MKIWDLPTRIYHWLQAILFIGLIGTGFKGAEPHVYLGLAIFTLIIWRFAWGLMGSETSQFKQFICSPKVVFNYFRGKYVPKPGHNPAGGWMVILMIGTLSTQCLSGLIITEIINLSMSDTVINVMESIHAICALLLILLVAIHILAIIAYKFCSKPLVLAMITGRQKNIYSHSLTFSSNIKAFTLLLGSVLITLLIITSTN